MPHSTTSSNYTRSINSRSSSQTSLSTAATSRASILQDFNKLNRKASTKPRKPRPKPQPGDWNSLLAIPRDHSNTPSQRSSLRITQSYSDLIGGSDLKNINPPRAMGGNRTSMNGSLDPKRRTTSYDEQYQYKNNAHGTARERVHRESPIIAELRTNVIVSIDAPTKTSGAILTNPPTDQRRVHIGHRLVISPCAKILTARLFRDDQCRSQLVPCSCGHFRTLLYPNALCASIPDAGYYQQAQRRAGSVVHGGHPKRPT